MSKPFSKIIHVVLGMLSRELLLTLYDNRFGAAPPTMHYHSPMCTWALGGLPTIRTSQWRLNNYVEGLVIAHGPIFPAGWDYLARALAICEGVDGYAGILFDSTRAQDFTRATLMGGIDRRFETENCVRIYSSHPELTSDADIRIPNLWLLPNENAVEPHEDIRTAIDLAVCARARGVIERVVCLNRDHQFLCNM